jgi:osmotically-inducible protein OsmY
LERLSSNAKRVHPFDSGGRQERNAPPGVALFSGAVEKTALFASEQGNASMADNDRYRYDWDRMRDRDDFGRGRGQDDFGMSRGRRPDYYGRSRDYGHRDEDEGYIARRGFGNESSGYGRDRGRGWDRDYDRGRERDFGDSAGYGTGGSARDWRDVLGDEDRRVGGWSYGTGYDRERERGYGGGRGAGYTDYASARDYGRPSRDEYRGREDYFGRGSRDYGEERGFFERAGDEIRSWFGDEDAERRREHDMREAGYHRGRGPRNYTRSDDRIREDVNDRLTDDPHVDASEIEVSVSNREVTLTGTVNSRFEKRHAEDLAESVSGVAHVQNNLRVQQQNALAGTGGSASTISSDRGGTSTTGTASRRRSGAANT